ncbi:MAG: N,N-dimethylformamidase beta subunit family domain-containing protein [Ignavibacteria bacterium]
MNSHYRNILLICFLLVILIILIKSCAQPLKITNFGVGLQEGGYSSVHSAYQGETISFYISTFQNPFTLKIYRYGKTKEWVQDIPNLKGGIMEVKENDEVYVKGCNWPVTVENFKIPDNWRAGAYIAEFPTLSDTINPVLFFVKEKDVTKRSKVLVACATATYQAYNMFGGKSSYPAYSSGGNNGVNYSVKLSFNRPMNLNVHTGVNRGSFYAYDAKLIRWLEKYGYGDDVDVIGSLELDNDSAYLNTHKVLLTCGHDEYWSHGMRENVTNFVNAGGNWMCMSGNTCWWQIRFENNYRTFVCYKHRDWEDLFGFPNPSLNTIEWYRTQRENPFIGVSYEHGGQINYHGQNQDIGCLIWKKGYGGYILHNTQNWVFKNSGLKDGDTLGYRQDSSIVGYECDATLFKYTDGRPVPTGTDQSPLNYSILGISPANHESKDLVKDWATMGIFKYKKTGAGFVFNAATIRWVWGLYENDSKVSIITKNVLDHFLKNNYPPEITQWAPFTVINDTRLGARMSFNSRDLDLQYGKSQTFRIDAKGYYDEDVNFAWAVNGSIVSEAKSKSFTYNSLKYDLGQNKVTALVYNDMDTVSVSWNINSIAGMGMNATDF